MKIGFGNKVIIYFISSKLTLSLTATVCFAFTLDTMLVTSFKIYNNTMKQELLYPFCR